MLSQSTVGIDARGRELIEMIRSHKDYTELAQLNFVVFVESIGNACAQVYTPCEKTMPTLVSMINHVNQGTILMQNLDDALAALSSMIQNGQNVKEIGESFNIIAGNQFELLRKHMAEKEEKKLDILPTVDYDDAFLFLGAGTSILVFNQPKQFESPAQQELFELTKKEFVVRSQIIQKCREMYAQLAEALPQQKQIWEKARVHMRNLQQTVLDLLEAAANQQHASQNPPIFAQNLSTSFNTLYGKNSQALQQQRQQDINNAAPPAPRPGECCVVL